MSEILLKCCSHDDNCIHPKGPWLPATAEYFFRDSRRPGAFRGNVCKLCTHREARERKLAIAQELETQTGLKATIRCELCGLECSTQVPHSHLRAVHGITTAQYREMGYETLSPARREQLLNHVIAKGQQRRLYGGEHPLFKGGHLTGNGYKIVYANGRRVPEHRHVMEQMLGRPLQPKEIVHHIDGNRRNNHPDNLQLVTPSEHAQLDANSKKFWHVFPETEEAAHELFKLGWSKAKIARAMRVEHRTVTRWLKK